MTKKLKKWEIVGVIIVALLGTLGHFLYDLTGQNQIVGKFFPVNESTWEHLKLLFFPYVVYGLVEWVYIGKNYHGFAFSKLSGVLSGMAFIVVSFYTYTGILGYSIDFINILIYLISVVIAFCVSFKQLSDDKLRLMFKTPSIIMLAAIALIFVIFTSNPPKINLFKDPITNTYGSQQTVAAAVFTAHIVN